MGIAEFIIGRAFARPAGSTYELRDILNSRPEVAVIGSVELIVQPDAHDVVGEMGVRSNGSGEGRC
jgi:hypothetical protein